MSDPVDLELSLRRKDGMHYTVDLVCTYPNAVAPVHPLAGQSTTVSFDMIRLYKAWPDPIAYGQALGEMLLGSSALAAPFHEVRATAAVQNLSLRVRLAIAPDASELHMLRWETLRDPHDDIPLAISEQILLTRTLFSADWRPVTLRTKAELQALVIIASPEGLKHYPYSPIDVAAERERALTGLEPLRSTVLATPDVVSLNSIIKCLRDAGKEGFDIVYLVCHGRMDNGDPWIALDDGNGDVAHIAGTALAKSLVDLPVYPRLMVLSSCQSAGTGTQDTLTALGPQLAISGVPAVIAMQDNFSQESNALFAPAFFQELQKDGRIDHALAVARQSIRDKDDWWVPAFFSRLRDGQIWYEPGFEQGDFEHWPTLLNNIRKGKCTPILGPGLLNAYIGSTRDLSRQLAEENSFPITSFAQDDLPKVAQFLAVKRDVFFMRTRFCDALCDALRKRFDAGTVSPDTEAGMYLAEAGRYRRTVDLNDPYHLLAALPFPIYLLANPDRLLIDALKEAGKHPQVRVCPWNLDLEKDESDIETPSAERPLVYYLFGHLDDDESLVLTEDDYFRYLIGMTTNRDVLPTKVGSALVNSALFFVGFRLEDWNFRVLFQFVVNSQGKRYKNYKHVAVQIEPQEDSRINIHAARDYLKSYFGNHSASFYGMPISIYWGSADDFIAELAEKLGTNRGSV